jgi:uncharacterized protein YjbJ (UPF0337 family)
MELLPREQVEARMSVPWSLVKKSSLADAADGTKSLNNSFFTAHFPCTPSAVGGEMTGNKDKAVGSVKETAGKITGDRETQAEGTAQKAKGDVKKAAHDVKEAAKGAARGLKED